MTQLWMRAGVNLSLTEEEAGAILASGASTEVIGETVKKIIMEGRYSFSGESYIPQPCIEQYNNTYGTNYRADDIDFEVDIDNPPIVTEECQDEDLDCDGECVGCERACADRIEIE